MSKYSIGDRVRVTDRWYGPRVGEIAVVNEVRPKGYAYPYEIEFANEIKGQPRWLPVKEDEIEPADRATIPIHRTEANHGVSCPTCGSGGCPDCMDPA